MTGRSETAGPAAAIPLDERIQRILVVNFGGIGDEILFFPVIQSLREAYPQARLSALVEPRARGILTLNPAIDEVLTLDIKGKPTPMQMLTVLGQLRARGFDLAIASGRSLLVPILLFLSGARYRVGFDANRLAWTLTVAAGLNPQQYAAEMYYDLVRSWLPSPFRLPQAALTQADREWARGFLAEAGLSAGERTIVLHPGTSKLAVEKKFIKAWDNQRWAQLAERLLADGCKVILAGGPDDAEAIAAIRARVADRVVDAYGRTQSLGQLAALIGQSSLLVCVDSAPLHLGVAVGTPTVAIFGPTDPDKLVPAGTIHQVVAVQDLACRPCLWDKRSTSCDALSCLHDVTVEAVEAAIWHVLPARS